MGGFSEHSVTREMVREDRATEVQRVWGGL